MIGDEARIVDAFCAHLESLGWTTRREVQHIDVVASRSDDRLYAEAKGRTAATGLDVDTLYGQLLRRLPVEELGHATFAVVVPDLALKSAQRVPERIRQALGIHIFTVDENGVVRHTGSATAPDPTQRAQTSTTTR